MTTNSRMWRLGSNAQDVANDLEAVQSILNKYQDVTKTQNRDTAAMRRGVDKSQLPQPQLDKPLETEGE